VSLLSHISNSANNSKNSNKLTLLRSICPFTSGNCPFVNFSTAFSTFSAFLLFLYHGQMCLFDRSLLDFCTFSYFFTFFRGWCMPWPQPIHCQFANGPPHSRCSLPPPRIYLPTFSAFMKRTSRMILFHVSSACSAQ